MADSNVPYLKLITSEHSVQPKYTEYVKTFLDMISPCVDIYNDFDVLFALNYAAGDQLDKLGELVGIGRQLPVVDERIPATLDDEAYRLVIKAKIYKNHWDGTRKGIRFPLNKIKFGREIAAINGDYNLKTYPKTAFSDRNFTSVFAGWTFTSTALAGSRRWRTQAGNLPTII